MFLTRNQYPTFLLDNSSLLPSSSAPDTSPLLSPRPVSSLLGVRQGNLWRLRGLTASEPPSSGEDRGVQSPVRMIGWQGGMTVVELQHDTCHTVTLPSQQIRESTGWLGQILFSCHLLVSSGDIISILKHFLPTFPPFSLQAFFSRNWKISSEFAFLWGFSW